MTLYYTFEIGLVRVRISGGVAGKAFEFAAHASPLPEKAKETLRNLINIDQPIGDLADRMCTITVPGTDVCGIWIRLRHASMAAIIFGTVGVILHCVGAGFLYYYWNKKARSVTRKWIRFFLTLAPVILFFNIAQYVGMTWDLTDIPPRSQSSAWGVSLLFAMMLSLLSVVPLILTSTVAIKALDEDLVSAVSHLKEARLDAAVQMRVLPGGQDPLVAALPNYFSAADPSSQQAYGQQPQYGSGPQPNSGQQPNYGQPPGYASYGQQPVAPPSWGHVPMGSEWATPLAPAQQQQGYEAGAAGGYPQQGYQQQGYH